MGEIVAMLGWKGLWCLKQTSIILKDRSIIGFSFKYQRGSKAILVVQGRRGESGFRDIDSHEVLARQWRWCSRTYPSAHRQWWWPTRSSHSWSQMPHILQSSKSVTESTFRKRTFFFLFAECYPQQMQFSLLLKWKCQICCSFKSTFLQPKWQ